MRAKLKKKAEPPQAASVCCVCAGFFGKGRRRQGLPACGKPAAALRTAAENPVHTHSRQEKKRKKKKSPPPSGGENTSLFFSPDSPVCQAVVAAHCIYDVDCLKSAQAAEQPAAAEREALGGE